MWKGIGDMLLTEVYKKLPKTNCGECGEATCIALALKVQTGQRMLSECPYVDAEEGVAGKEGSVVDDSYVEAAKRLEGRLADMDFAEAARATGLEYQRESDALEARVLNRRFEVRHEGLFEDGAACHDSWYRLIIYDFVIRQGEAGLTGERVPLESFPNTPSHIKSFQKRAESQLGQLYGEDAAGLLARLDELGADRIDSMAQADLAFSLQLLPGVPMYLEFWAADEEFPAGCKLFVDSSAIDKLDIEYIARLIGKAASSIAGTPVR